jgi:hypothetical protein
MGVQNAWVGENGLELELGTDFDSRIPARLN